MLSAGTTTRWLLFLIVGLIGSATGCASMRSGASADSLSDVLESADSQPYPTAVRKSPAEFDRTSAELPTSRPVPPSPPVPKEKPAPPREVPVEHPTPAPIKVPPINSATVPAARPLHSPSEPPAIALAQPINHDSSPPRPVALERPSLPPAASAPASAQPPAAELAMAAENALAMTTPASLPGSPLSAHLTPPPAVVQVATATTPVATTPVATSTPPKPGEHPPAVDMADLNRRLDELTDVLESEVHRRRAADAKDDALPRMEQQLRLMYVLAGRTEPAATGIDSLPEAEREAYRHLLFGLSTWLAEDEAARAGMRNAKVLRSLRESASELSLGSKLDLSHLTFCEKVEYFGWFTEFPRSEFQPKQQVILYVEVDNFAAEEKGPQAFETELQGSYQIFDASGAVVDERKLPLDREVCRNYRRDYFLAYRIYMPAEIAEGSYRLELTIEDLKAKGDFKGRKLGQAMIDFSIRN